MDKLRNLLALLIMHRHNLQMIHWNTVGPLFTDVHKTVDEYVEHVTDDIDRIAEFIKMLNIDYDIPSFMEVFDILNNDGRTHVLLNMHRYTDREAWSHVIEIFDDIIDTMNDLYDDIPHDLQSEIDNLIYYYRLEGNYKSKARLANK